MSVNPGKMCRYTNVRRRRWTSNTRMQWKPVDVRTVLLHGVLPEL